MKRSRPVASKAAKPTLESEIAQLRDLDLKGLRLRWQSMFRRQAPSHLPRHHARVERMFPSGDGGG
jgi:hypothetical protein